MKIGKLILTKDITEVVDTLHNVIGAREWSGVLFYKLVSGDITKLKDLVFEAKYLYPMDIGTTASTSFEYSGELMDIFDIYPEAMECSTGLVHSHHNMNAFFSTTDMKELEENSTAYNYYVSLVVNFAKTPVCKIGFPVKSKIQSTLLDTEGNPFTFEEETNSIKLFDLDVEFECSTELSWLNNRIKELNKPKPSYIPSYASGYIPAYSELFDDCTVRPATPMLTSKFSNVKSNLTTASANYTPNVNLANQFLINLCSTHTHGQDIYTIFKSLSNLPEEEYAMFEELVDTEFEPVFMSTFDTTEIDFNNVFAVFKALTVFEDLYGSEEFYLSLKEIIKGYL